MNPGSIGKKDLFKAISASVTKGGNLNKARKIAAAEFDIARGRLGKIPKSQAIALTKRLKSEHLLKSRVGVDKISTTGATAKRILKEIVTPKDAGAGAISFKEERAAHIEEKQKVLKEAGLKESAANINHEAKPLIQKALDQVSLEELETGKPSSGVLHKSAAQAMSLRATVVPPRPEEKKSIVVLSREEESALKKEEDNNREENQSQSSPLAPIPKDVSLPTPEPPPVRAIDPFGD